MRHCPQDGDLPAMTQADLRGHFAEP